MSYIDIIKRLINPLKIDIVKYPNSDLRRRKKLLDFFDINKIIDVGANAGQYAKSTFKIGFKGEIVSFEPISQVFEVLEGMTKGKDNWTAYNVGLGNKEEVLNLNISENTYSSSFLEIMPNHLKGASDSRYFKKEKVKIKTLDSMFNEITNDQDVVLLKLDVQGYERNVLEGARESLSKIKGIQIEMSIEELYKGEMLFPEMLKYLKTFGFNLYSLENGFYNSNSGKLLQVDGIFFKTI